MAILTQRSQGAFNTSQDSPVKRQHLRSDEGVLEDGVLVDGVEARRVVLRCADVVRVGQVGQLRTPPVAAPHLEGAAEHPLVGQLETQELICRRREKKC